MKEFKERVVGSAKIAKAVAIERFFALRSAIANIGGRFKVMLSAISTLAFMIVFFDDITQGTSSVLRALSDPGNFYKEIVGSNSSSEKGSTGRGSVEVTYLPSSPGDSKLDSTAPGVFWYGLRYYPTTAERLYSRSDRKFEGSIMLQGAFGYEYYRNMRVVFAGIENGEVVFWHPPVLDGFRGSSAQSPAIDFSTNRLPHDLILCIDHGPGVPVRSLLYFSANYETEIDQRPGARNGDIQISDQIAVVEMDRIGDEDCISEIRIAAAEFGVKDAASLQEGAVKQYRIDEEDSAPKVAAFVESITFPGQDISVNVKLELEQNVSCSSLGQIGIETGSLTDRLESFDIWSRTEVTRTPQSTCGETDGIDPDRSMANGDIAHYVAAQSDIGPFLAVCFNTPDISSSRNTISVEWFRVDPASQFVQKLDSPDPFKTMDSVFCHNSEKWPRPNG